MMVDAQPLSKACGEVFNLFTPLALPQEAAKGAATTSGKPAGKGASMLAVVCSASKQESRALLKVARLSTLEPTQLQNVW